MKIMIRRGDEKDFPCIFLMIKEFAEFQKTPDKVFITSEQMQEEKDIFKCFVVETDRQIIGYATYFFAYYSWSGKALYLDDLYVKEAYRKQNVGTKLLKEIIAVAQKENCKKMRWQVSKWNENAIGFYKKMGASIDDVDINCDLKLA